MAFEEDVGERARARLGTVLKGKWRLDSVLGVGGMACVYAATHRNQSRVAIKMLHPEIALDPEVTSRFLREGYVANAVEHPGTVKVLDDDITEDGAPFLVMERLSGETLDARLERLGPLPPEEVVLLADQLLDVLDAAHSRYIVHRDLKPENLFLTEEGRLKVLDFGIARLRELSAPAGTATRVGSLLGTPTFMASEQALGRWSEVDGRTDLWAVGATLYTLLSGHFVHEGCTLQEQLVLAATRPARPLAQVAPSVSAELCAVVDRALSFDKGERWADARSMKQALRAAAPEGTVFPTLSGPGSPAPSAAVRRASAATEIAPAVTGHIDTPTQALTRTATPSLTRRGSLLYLMPLAVLIIALGGVMVSRRMSVGGSPAVAQVESMASGIQAEHAPKPSPVPPGMLPVPSTFRSAPLPPALPASSPVPTAERLPQSHGTPASRPITRGLATPKPPATAKPPPKRVEPPSGDTNPFDRRH